MHGPDFDSRAWVKLGDFLASKGMYVIAPDLRGRGLSDKPPHGYGIAFHANDLIALCDSLGLSKVIFVGHSLGAAIGLYFCALFPNRVEKFVLINAGVRLPRRYCRLLEFTEQVGAGLSVD